jgi:hypothetical protein
MTCWNCGANVDNEIGCEVCGQSVHGPSDSPNYLANAVDPELLTVDYTEQPTEELQHLLADTLAAANYDTENPTALAIVKELERRELPEGSPEGLSLTAALLAELIKKQSVPMGQIFPVTKNGKNFYMTVEEYDSALQELLARNLIRYNPVGVRKCYYWNRK